MSGRLFNLQSKLFRSKRIINESTYYRPVKGQGWRVLHQIVFSKIR